MNLEFLVTLETDLSLEVHLVLTRQASCMEIYSKSIAQLSLLWFDL